MATENYLKDMAFSASELRRITGWPFPLIEDYISIRDRIIYVSRVVDTKEDLLKRVEVVTTTPYTPDTEDMVIICDTRSIEITINLPAGIDGLNYRIINFGGTGNKAYVTPNGTELLGGENETEYLVDQEALMITYYTGYGWN